MTAPAAAPSSGPAPVAPPAPRAPPHLATDAHAFAAMLDSLPSTTAKASASTNEKQHDPSDEPQQDQSRRGHAGHSLMSDGALLMSLPFALRAASMPGENPAHAADAPSTPTAATLAPGGKDNATSIGASGTGGSVGRLIGERAFHFGASSASLAAQADLNAGSVAAGFAQAEAMPAKADAVPSAGAAAAPVANLAGAAATNRASSSRTAAHEGARGARKSEVSAPAPAARGANPAAAVAPPQSSGDKAPDNRPRDPGGFTPPSTSQTSPFGAQLSASLAAGPSFAAYASTPGVADPSVAQAASAVTPSAALAAPPVKEIDVDLSPGGLEDVSMTMRLAGDKLSVVIRAGSSQTLSSIEGARDAIADRLAAIGQPLDSLIVKQTGLNADGNTNANPASADDSSTQAGGRDGSNDAGSPRRGAGRDRSF
jgi:Flagellar hook-length control protein FliK